MDEALRAIVPIFVEEAREHLQAVSSGVFELERAPGARTAGTHQATCRAAHSLKGSAATLGLTEIEEVAHALETLLIAAGKAAHAASRAEIDALVGACEAIEAGLSGLASGGEGQVPELGGVLARLRNPAAPIAQAAPAPKAAPAPAAPKPGADLLPSFRAEALDLLEQLTEELGQASPATEVLEAILRSLAGSASVLQDARITSGVEALRGALGKGAEGRKAARAGVAELRAAVEGLGAAPPAPPPQAAPPSPRRLTAEVVQIFLAEAEATLNQLEEALGALRSPRVTDREARAKDASRLAHGLKGSAGAMGAGRLATLSKQLEGDFRRMGQAGDEAVRALAAAAGALVDSREALGEFARESAAVQEASLVQPAPEARPAPNEPERAAPAAQPTPEAARGETQRVSVATLDSLSRRIEELVTAREHEEHRARRLREAAVALGEAAGLLYQAQRSARAQADAPAELTSSLELGLEAVRRLRGELGLIAKESARDADQSRLVATVVREDLRDMRMVPASLVLEPMRRAARDAAARLGKSVDIDLQGGDVRLDRRILDELKDPLLHLVRNAVDHGIESAERRAHAGKRATGRLELKVERRGHRLAVTIADDGGGLDLARVRETAAAKGLLSREAALELPDAEAVRLIFRPGFSTATEVSAISGRGIGLDVVQETATRLQGTVAVDSQPGAGTRFTLDLPLTLAATLGLLVRAAGDLFALPSDSVARVVRLKVSELGTVAGQRTAEVGGEQLPLASLGQVLRLPRANLGEQSSHVVALVLSTSTHRVAVAVDELVGQQELVVHGLGAAAGRANHLAGATLLDDGRLVPVLNPVELATLARPQRRREAQGGKIRVVVADDSITTRSAMKALLELAGYEVVPAADGEEAYEAVVRAQPKLVVSDVQMPRLDGLGLTRRLRADARFTRLPVVLVTSLGSADDRAAGLEAGADGYLVKREVERGRLLELVQQLIPGGPA